MVCKPSRLIALLPLNHRRVLLPLNYRRARKAKEEEKSERGMHLEGYKVEGLSIAGHKTCIIFPLSIYHSIFDIGQCHSRAISQNFLSISHAHMDHVSYVIYSVKQKLKQENLRQLAFLGMRLRN